MARVVESSQASAEHGVIVAILAFFFGLDVFEQEIGEAFAMGNHVGLVGQAVVAVNDMELFPWDA